MPVPPYRRQIIAALGTDNETLLRLARYRYPDSILLAVPEHLRKEAGDLRRRLSHIDIHSVSISPYDINHNRQALRRGAHKWPAREVEVCLSAGPYAFRLAAMQLARDKDFECHVVSDGTPLRIHSLSRTAESPVVVTDSLEAYLATRDVQLGSSYPLASHPPYPLVAEHIAENLDAWRELIRTMRIANASEGQISTEPVFPLPVSSLRRPHFDLLRFLAEHRIFGHVHETAELVECSLSSDHWAYLNGHWLEVYAYHRLRGIFGDCRCGQTLVTQQTSREIDFIGIREGRFTLAECKTSLQSYALRYLRDLQSLSQQMGEPKCLRLYITDRIYHGSQQDRHYTEFVDYARENGIEVVFGDQLERLGEIVNERLVQK